VQHGRHLRQLLPQRLHHLVSRSDPAARAGRGFPSGPHPAPSRRKKGER
jgi:hypothetical protein